jgi:plastocyanin
VQDLSSTRKIAAVAIGVTALLPAAAQGATRNAFAGPPAKVAGLPAGADSNAFYRKTLTVHVGDKVKWKINGLHSVTFPVKGKQPPPFIGPDASGGKYSGINDAAGNPFWFNGLPRLTLNPAGAFPAGGKTYGGKKAASSGVSLGAPKPYTLKFTKKGTYTYYCTVHTGMKAKVKVVGKGKQVPSNRANAKAAKKEYAKVVKRLKKDGKFAGPPGNAVEAGHDTLKTTFLRFFPATKSVPVGTTVTFSMPKVTTEIHTISFGPADYLQSTADAFIGPDPANPQAPPVLSGQVAYPSDPPPFPGYDGTSHGNGFFSTGVLDREAATPSPGEAQVTFTKAGTYNFICMVHPNMKGSIVVG